jgi:plastocyanin
LVHRLRLRRRLICIGGLLAVLAAVLPAGAQGANRRVAIGNYMWSNPKVEIDLGEHVTWHWVGPDTVHSVTGVSANAKGWDSDPGNPLPNHNLGFTYQLSFSSPGVYEFECKLHPLVGGTVIVSSTPGDPVSEPDPIPPVTLDRKPAEIGGISLDRHQFRHRGTGFHFALDEPAHIDADYYFLKPQGGRRFAGYSQWNGYVGLNLVRFGAARKHFKARPGRYVAYIRSTDRSGNTTKAKQRRFRLLPAHGPA